MSKHRSLVLSKDERQHLENLIRSGSQKARTITRARILLLSDRSQADQRTDQQVADSLLCSMGTVRNIRSRYLEEGLEAALTEKPRPGASIRPKITGDIQAHLLALARSAPPEGRAGWTLELLADKMVELKLVESISRNTIHRHLKGGR